MTEKKLGLANIWNFPQIYMFWP